MLVNSFVVSQLKGQPNYEKFFIILTTFGGLKTHVRSLKVFKDIVLFLQHNFP